ncbi:hypothetical protein [Candidatus Clostridium stratigraminis]|uniref:Uncharacterized protein n=1 Tax=Candidatus Clostridium stratigraminis TaxID=3381661 RepID=A0ABW8T7W3_9CLOT
MFLIIASLIMGLVGFAIGGMLGGPEIFIYLFAVVGVLSPGLYVLEKLYKEIKRKEDKK